LPKQDKNRCTRGTFNTWPFSRCILICQGHLTWLNILRLWRNSPLTISIDTPHPSLQPVGAQAKLPQFFTYSDMKEWLPLSLTYLGHGVQWRWA
jgi:hypothetical protein